MSAPDDGRHTISCVTVSHAVKRREAGMINFASLRIFLALMYPLISIKELEMLDGYFDYDGVKGQQAVNNRKRLLAVQAALEIAKSNNASQHLINDMEAIKSSVSEVADAIQAALEKE